MAKINSREKIVVGVDAVKKYARIAETFHKTKKVSICVTKDVWYNLNLEGRSKTEIIIWCSNCTSTFRKLSDFLTAHNIES